MFARHLLLAVSWPLQTPCPRCSSPILCALPVFTAGSVVFRVFHVCPAAQVSAGQQLSLEHSTCAAGTPEHPTRGCDPQQVCPGFPFCDGRLGSAGTPEHRNTRNTSATSRMRRRPPDSGAVTLIHHCQLPEWRRGSRRRAACGLPQSQAASSCRCCPAPSSPLPRERRPRHARHSRV